MHNTHQNGSSSQLVVRFLLVLLAGTTHAAAAAALAIVLGNNRSTNALHFLVLLLDLLSVRLRIRVQPGLALLQGIHDLLLLLRVHLLAQTLVLTRPLRGGPHGVNVAVERVLRPC